MVWVAFALMTGTAVLCLVWPLARSRPALDGRSADIDFYASQLAEIETEAVNGLVSPAEADAARGEVGRRLLASAGSPVSATPPPGGSRARRLAAVLAAACLAPALALLIYLPVGHPGQPDEPIAARAAAPVDFASALSRIEAHLAAHPDDSRGFELVAPIYLRIGRYDDAARAYAALIRLQGANPDRLAAHGEALYMAAEGVVTAEARADFDKALGLDPKLPQARFFQALAAEQDGDKARAHDLWAGLAADTPADAPWAKSVQQHLAAESGRPVQASAAPASSAGEGATDPANPTASGVMALPPGQRQAAIRSMVDGLAARLAQNGNDPEGWLRLVRAYTVLGDQDKARGALSEAHKALTGDTPSLSRLDALARQLGLEG